MYKYIVIILFTFISISANVYSQEVWMDNWQATLSKLDSMFFREQAHFRLMQTYTNEATEDLILKDIDTLNVFMTDVNAHIEICNKFELPNTNTGKNAAETLNLKVGALKEYFDQCLMQIQVNNNILQRKLKNESLDFKVSQITELKLGNYSPLLK